MSTVIIYTIITLSALGIVAAIVLYFVARKFKVYENPLIDDVEEVLPASNCGGCGYAGCRNFAEAIVNSDEIGNLYCPVGGNDVMSEIGKLLGKEATEKQIPVAVVRCNGRPEFRSKKNTYDGTATCAIENSLYAGEGGCPFGCLGHGDCVASCNFDAIHMDKETGLPYVNDENCTACNACVEACPRDIIELRTRQKKDRKIYVDCINEEKGAIAVKNCKVACIGCGKCVKVCPFEAITLENNLAYIDPDKCRLCRKCPPVCPTNSIIEIGFPPRKEKPAKTETGDKKEEKTTKPDTGDSGKSSNN
jgi:Na+-translocating ferredoxin:NAD+ oxidoreductase RNF subunit RnfB